MRLSKWCKTTTILYSKDTVNLSKKNTESKLFGPLLLFLRNTGKQWDPDIPTASLWKHWRSPWCEHKGMLICKSSAADIVHSALSTNTGSWWEAGAAWSPQSLCFIGDTPVPDTSNLRDTRSKFFRPCTFDERGRQIQKQGNRERETDRQRCHSSSLLMLGFPKSYLKELWKGLWFLRKLDNPI